MSVHGRQEAGRWRGGDASSRETSVVGSAFHENAGWTGDPDVSRVSVMKVFAVTLVLAISPTVAVTSLEAGEARSLFDGESLEGWEAPDTSYWSVEDGAITATSSEENPCDENQFLVWRGGRVDDFVLRWKFRVEGGPRANSGIQVRSRVGEDGYQVDISQPDAPWLGAIYDEHGRKMLAKRGEKTVIGPDGSFDTSSLETSAERAIEAYRPGEWNDYEITAKGEKIVVKLNGHRTAVVVDRQESERELEGLLALQLHSGPPMRVQFEDIVLEPLAAE